MLDGSLKTFFRVALSSFVLIHTYIYGEGFLYSGDTLTGWQIFEYNLESETSTQLTFSSGDKRSPQYNTGSGRVYWRNTNGGVQYMDDSLTVVSVEEPSVGVSSFAVSPEGANIYFTRLATGNNQRQFLWRVKVDPKSEPKPELIWRPKTRTASQIAIAPNGQALVITHLRQLKVEEMFLIDLTDGFGIEPISPSGEMCIYPSFDQDGDFLYFSKYFGDSNYDLMRLNMKNRQLKRVTETEKRSEFTVTIDDRSEFAYLESRGNDGIFIYSLELATGLLQKINLGRLATEPFYLPAEYKFGRITKEGSTYDN